LAPVGLTYDLVIAPRHLPAACELVARFPEQPFVLDHIAKPLIKDGVLSPWDADLRKLAALPNVCCKVSGLVTEADWAKWQPADFTPYLDVVWEAFGARRIMFGSDWPVCLLAGDYAKVAIVTGANEGIGRATALLFAGEGAKVALAARREKEGQEAVREFGRLDILINNAAAHWLGTVLTATAKDYDTLFGVNVKGYGLCAKAAIPHLRKTGKGCIVNVASVNAFIGMPGQSLYNATKAAIVSLTKSMAIDFPELRVNCVAPGFTDTPTIWDSFKAFGFPMEEGYRLLGDGVLLKRLAQPIEIARAILFMASDEASYSTGSTLLVDGGIASVGNPAAGIVNDPRLDEPLQRKPRS